jgi:hypothetical protein
MNPYLENPQFWSQIHSRLIVGIADVINPQIRPKYRMEIEQRVYLDTQENGKISSLVEIPDNVIFRPSSVSKTTKSSGVAVAEPEVKPVQIYLPQLEEITERYLQVKDVETNEVITVIEILSPKNKTGGEGRNKYLKKREQVLMSLTHFIEIDLLRTGEIMPRDLSEEINTHYRIVISRSDQRPQADLYAFNLPQKIPSIPLPLKPEDQEPLIPLQDLLHSLYESGSYDLVINYQKLPLPELTPEDADWVDNLLKQQGLRP